MNVEFCERGNHQANLDAALRLAAAGLTIFPVRIFQNDEGHWNKRPFVKDWQQVATTDPAQIRRWWDDFPDAVPGIELRRAGLIVLDADRHGGPDGIAAIKDLVTVHGELPEAPRAKTAGDGIHFIFRQPNGLQLGNAEGSLPEGIDVRGAGGFIVGPGAVRPDGARYQTHDGAIDLAKAFATDVIPVLPEWLVDIIRKKKEVPEDTASAAQNFGGPGHRERIFAEAALAGCVAEIEKANRGTRNNTLNSVSYRLGRIIARGWIEENAVVNGLSRACQVNGLAHDDGLASVYQTMESGIRAGRADPHSDLENRLPSEAKHRSTSNIESPPLIPVVWDGEVQQHNPTKWLVRDLIPMDSIGLIVGESTAGKTFAAIDLARALGCGGSFLTKVARKGGTLYVAAEASGTIRGRLQAARLGPKAELLDNEGRFKDSARKPENLPVVTIPHPPGLTSDNEVDRLIATAIDVSGKMQERFGVPLLLIIIDTLLAAFPINDWNSPAEVSRVMNILDRIKRETGAVVLGIHHHGKDINRGPAGSFALKAASDVVLAVFADIDNEGNVSGRRLTMSKLRDGQTGWGCDFSLVSHKIGTDDEGLDIFSAYLDPKKETAAFGRPTPIKTKSPSQSSSILEDAVTEALDKFGDNRRLNGIGPETCVVPIGKVRDIFGQNYKPEGRSSFPQDAIRSAFNRAMRDVRKKGVIEIGQWNDTEWIWHSE